MQNKNNTELIKLYHQAEDYFFSAISKKISHFNDAATAYLTGVESNGLNLLIVRSVSALTEDVVQQAIQLFDEAGVPFSVIVQNDAKEKLLQLNVPGLTCAYISTCMQSNLDHCNSDIKHSDQYSIESTDSRLADWGLPLASAFESESTHRYQVQHQAAIDAGKQLKHFTLYIKSVPICSLTLSIQHDIARLDDIGTQVEFQGKGYASALLQSALTYAKSKNVRWCFLEASNDGASIYRRAGFSDLCEYTAFSR